MSDEGRGCLYDGSANIESFSDDELQDVRSAIPAAPRGEEFSVITNIRSANFSRGSPMTAPFGIVLHHTGGYFENDLATLTKPGTGVSANDLIDKDGRIFELCEFPKRADHAGESDLHGIRTGTRTAGESKSSTSATARTRTPSDRSTLSSGAAGSAGGGSASPIPRC
jgi:N-acetylmuramoyl-L-alanine amidase